MSDLYWNYIGTIFFEYKYSLSFNSIKNVQWITKSLSYYLYTPRNIILYSIDCSKIGLSGD